MPMIRVRAALPAVLVASGAWLAGGALGQGESPSVSDVEDASIRDTLRLTGYRVVSAQIRDAAGLPSRRLVDIDLGAGPTTLVLDLYSLRAPGFSMTVQDESGVHAVEPPPVTTYRGVEPSTGATVAASIIDGRLIASVRPVSGEPIFVQPLADAAPGADATACVVYTQSQVDPGDWRCGTDDLPGATGVFSARGPGADPVCISTAEVLFDTDYPFFQQHASAAATTTDIETIANQADAIYRRDVTVAISIKQVNVRTVAADPYTDLATANVDPGTLLDRVGTVWASVPTPTRDLVHLMTGRDLNSSTIGIAWVGVVCRTSSNTGLSQSLFTSNLSMRTILTAHEMGHNFGANHDASGTYIMAPATGPSSQAVFSPTSIAAINTYVAGNGSCLSASGPGAVSDTAQVNAGQSVLVDVLANDSSGCGAVLSIVLPQPTTMSGGSVTLSVGTGPGGRNQIRYTAPTSVPAAGLTDTFTYRITEASSNLSASATVSVNVTGSTPPPCAADFNRSGGVSVQDVFDFLAAYFGGSPAADVNGTGSISVQDIFDFLSAYFAGC